MKDIKAFVFDIGDCIDPSTRFETENLMHLKRKYNLPKSFVKRYLECDKYHELHMCHAMGEPKIMRMTLKKLGIDTDYKRLSKEMQNLYWIKFRKYFTKDKVGKEFPLVINLLKKRGYKVGVLSDNSLQAKKKYVSLLNKIGLKFDAFIVSADVGLEKPSRRFFQSVLKQLNTAPEHSVYLGNNLKRDAAAKKYGWDFVWVFGFMKINRTKYKGKKMKFITVKNIESYLKHV